MLDNEDNVISVTAEDFYGNQNSALITITRESEVINVAMELTSDVSEPPSDPLDLDEDDYQNEDETACGSDPYAVTSTPANYTGAAWPTDPGDVYFNPAKVKRDEDGEIIGSYLWPDCQNPDDDQDIMPDQWELQYGFNPQDADDADDDPDGDGFDNLTEYLNGTDPRKPPPTDFKIEVLDSSELAVYDTWLPGYGKVLKITAIWSGDQPPATARFTLANTSSYAGRAVNDPDPSLSSTNYPGWYKYSGFDFGLTTTDPTTDPTVHSFAQGPISVTGTDGVGADTVYTVFLQCWDYGGRARLIVTHPTDSSISSEIWIPKGSGTNGIGSSWQYDNDPAKRLEANADIDAIAFEESEKNTAPLGDDFNNFAEYRGILYAPAIGEALVHERLNPHRKDLFLRAEGFDDAMGDPYRDFDAARETDPAYYPFRMGRALHIAGIDVHNTTGWGHDATEDGSFFTYHRNGTISVIENEKVTGISTDWALTWPQIEWEFKIEGDSPDAWVPVSSWGSPNILGLDRAYSGGSGGDYAIRMSLPHISVLIVRLNTERKGAFSVEDGFITPLGASKPVANNMTGSRYWTWSSKGWSRKAADVTSYGIAEALKIPLDHYFSDRPYAKGTVWTGSAWEPADTSEGSADLKLMPLNLCEDYQDKIAYTDGYHDLGLKILLGNHQNNYWDGDRRLKTHTEWASGNLSPFDIDNNGYVELPAASDPTADIFANQHDKKGRPYSKARVLQHTITHEICHVLAGPKHSYDPDCVMYEWSADWRRDDHLSDDYRSLLMVINKIR